MKGQCKTCGHVNSSDSIVCTWCKGGLVESKTSRIDELISKQEQLEIRHRKELADLKKELFILRNELSESINSINKEVSPDNETKELESLNLEKKTSKSIEGESSSNSKENKAESLILENKNKQPPRLVNHESKAVTELVQKQPVEPRKPTELELKLKKLIEPLYDGLDLISNAYTKYKTEGKLPVFFMTIAGIVAILFGFGYLMQYSLSAAGKYQGLIKVGLGFVAALVSIILGIRLSKKESDLKEYASALISLGVILNYIMIYYLTELGSFPALSESFIGFLLIVANTGIAIAFSLKFEAKIIAVLFVVGGAFTPFYLNANEDGSLYYLYLWFLTVGACYVSIKIKWKTLQYLAFSISALLLEIVVFVQEPASSIYVIYYHLFAYLFFYFTFFAKGRIKQELDKIDLVVLSSNLGFFSWNLFSAGQSNLNLLGVVYLLNAVVFIGLLMKFKQELDKIGKLVFLIIIGLFIGLAIPSFFHQSVMGLFWSIEAIMLIYLGFLYGNELVRKEGYLLLGFALVKLGLHSAEIVYSWNQSLLHTGFINFIILGLVIIVCWVFGQKYKEHFNNLEKGLFKTFGEIIPVWINIVFFIVAYRFMGSWSLVLLIIPIFSMFYWGVLFKTKSSEILVGFFLVGTLLKLLYHGVFLTELLDSPNLLSTFDFQNFLLMGGTIIVIWVLAPSQFRKLNRVEKFFYRTFKEVVPVFLASTFLIAMFTFIEYWVFPLLIVSLFGLIFWSKLFNTITSVWFGYASLLLLILGFVISVQVVYSVHFSDQLLFAQVSMVGLVLCLWFLKSYYKLIGLEYNSSFGFANALRVVFFCLLPLLFINSVRKIDADYIGSALWVSVLIAYFLYKKLKYLALSVELMVLTLISFLFIVGMLDDIGIFAGVFVLILFVLLEKSYKKDRLEQSTFKKVFTFVPYFLIVLVWLIMFKLTGENLSVAFAFSALLLLIVVYFKDKLALINFSYVFATKLSVLVLFLGFGFYIWGESGLTPLFSIMYICVLGVLLYNKKSWYDLENKVNRWSFTFIFHQLSVIITVAIILDLFHFSVIGPISSVLLVIHAIILIFIALKQRRAFINKVSIVLFVIALLKVVGLDISEFSMIQKVIVLLILGVLLLAASYGYVKLKKRFETDDLDRQIEG